MNPWDADIYLSREAAHELVRDRFVGLGNQSFTLLSSGWDNDAYLADERVVFRFPRRKVAASLIENEIKILPLLAPHLPLSISEAKFIGAPTIDYPFTWAGYVFMDGSTACRMEWTDDERAANAPILAEFLKALHGIPVDGETRTWAPEDDLARTDMERRLPKVKERLAKFPEILPSIDPDPIEKIAIALAALENRDTKSEISCWSHGDLYARHILANTDHKICGVIDWGDVHLGDIAGDLSIAWTFLPASAHDLFRETYGGIDEATWNRAKFRSIFHASTIAEYGHGIGDAHLLNSAKFCLGSIVRNS